MSKKDSDGFRERFENASGQFIREEGSVQLPEGVGGLALDTNVDFSQLKGFGAPAVDFNVAAQVQPQGGPNLQIDTDLNKLSEGVRKLNLEQQSDRIRRLLEEALQQMNRQLFQQAIQTLDQAAAIDPSASVVMFLKAQCLYYLEDYRAALHLLEKARTHIQDPQTLILALILHAVCLRAITEQIEAQVQQLVEQKRYKDALVLIDKERQQHPDNIALIYHRCAVLMIMKHYSEARQSINEGMRLAEPQNAALFRLLENQIKLAENERYLEAARVALRRNNPEAACDQLQQCRAALGGHPEFEAIRAYAQERLNRGFLGSVFARDKARPLDDEGRQMLLRWLLSDELGAGLTAMNTEHFGEAGQIFAKAEQIDGRCRMVCFLHAVAIYKQFVKMVDKKSSLQELNRHSGSLETASRLLRVTVSDHVMGEQSRNLCRLVDGYRAQLQQAVQAEAQAKPINDLVQEYNTFMQGLDANPPKTDSQRTAALRKLVDIRMRAQNMAQANTRNPGGRVMNELVQAIDQMLLPPRS